MKLIIIKNTILIFLAFVFISCERIVGHKGSVLSIKNKKLENVLVKIEVNGRIIEEYGIEVLDTIHHLKRDSINKSLKLKSKDYLINEKGYYIQFKPYITDSNGKFDILIHESTIFGRPKYKLIFKKEGYKDYEFLGNWENSDNLKIIMKK